jgi:hypothetical protein
MFGPPRATSTDLGELVCRVGGTRRASLLLGVTPEALIA